MNTTHRYDNGTSSVENATTAPAPTVASIPTLVTKHEAASLLGISPETLKKYRRQEGSTLIEGIHYHVWNSRVIRYNPQLIADWGLNRNNPAAHQHTIDAYLASLPSNQPKKRGRKAS